MEKKLWIAALIVAISQTAVFAGEELSGAAALSQEAVAAASAGQLEAGSALGAQAFEQATGKGVVSAVTAGAGSIGRSARVEASAGVGRKQRHGALVARPETASSGQGLRAKAAGMLSGNRIMPTPYGWIAIILGVFAAIYTGNMAFLLLAVLGLFKAQGK